MNDNYTLNGKKEKKRKEKKGKKRMYELCFLSDNNIIHLSYFLLP
jgi:hypothetical protein